MATLLRIVVTANSGDPNNNNHAIRNHHANNSTTTQKQEENNDENNNACSEKLYSHAVHLLRLVKFVDLNIRLVERLLSLHDEMLLAEKKIQSLYLSGNIGREAHTPADHHRLATLLYPDSLRATVGIAATVYYRYIKEQSRLLLMQKKKEEDNGENSENGTTDPVMVQSMRAVPSMSSLASFLTTEEESDDDDDDDDDGGVFGGPRSKDLRSLVLSERVLNLPVASAVQSLSHPEQAKLVGSVLLRIDTAMAKLTNTPSTP